MATPAWIDLSIVKELKCDRGLPHALAELTANARDASGDKKTKFVFHQHANTAVLIDHGPQKLESCHLLSGYSDSRGDPTKAGTHGLGLKDALAILIHLDYTVTIASHDVKYEFALQPSQLDPAVPSIHVRQVPIASSQTTQVTITSPQGELAQKLQEAVGKLPQAKRTKVAAAPKQASASAVSAKPVSKATAKRARREAYARKSFSPAADGEGKIMFLGVERFYNGPPFYYDWDITLSPCENGSRKKLFDDDQHVKPEACVRFDAIIKDCLLRAGVKLPAEAKGTFEYCLFASQAELCSYYGKFKAQVGPASAAGHPQAPPCKVHKPMADIPSAIERLNRGMDEHRRRTRYLVAEVQKVLQVGLGIAEFYPSGSYAKATQLPLHSDLDLIMVFNHAGDSLKQATAEQVAFVQRCLEAAFPTRLSSPKVTAFSFQCVLDGVEVDILPVSSSIWRATAERRTSAAPGDEPYYSAAMAETQVATFKARAQALERKELAVRPVIRLLKAWLQGLGPWETGTKPRSCLIEELVLKAAESRALVPSQEALVRDVLALLSALLPRPIVDDPIYEANNLAAGLDPATVIGYAKAALAAWPTAFLRKLAM